MSDTCVAQVGVGVGGQQLADTELVGGLFDRLGLGDAERVVLRLGLGEANGQLRKVRGFTVERALGHVSTRGSEHLLSAWLGAGRRC